jgi:ribosomal protein L11 methylase PrmA
MNSQIDPASFRDPSGFVFSRGGALFRQVNGRYRKAYDQLMSSGLYQALVEQGLLIPHAEERNDAGLTPDSYRVLRPDRLPFISYPYEWCFGQLHDAALLTLRLHKEALRFGMSLKDASAYNVQFRRGAPVFIDTLSFESYEEGRPWTAYRQFCQHFLAPLSLMSRGDVRLGHLVRSDLDGIPLDLASRLLPVGTWFGAGLLTHVHLHSAAQRRYAGRRVEVGQSTALDKPRMTKMGQLGLIDSLEGAVRKQSYKPRGTTWADYYQKTNYSDQAMDAKRLLVAEFLDSIRPRPATLWDLGANTGVFSRIASQRGIDTIAWDIDPAAVELNYRQSREAGDKHLLPLIQDLSNPSPNQGWAQEERRSLMQRGPADVIFALALVHHLSISHNVPLSRLVRFLFSVGVHLIIEFVPKSDSQVQRLLASREDIFSDYTQEAFEAELSACFEMLRSAPIPGTSRRLYLLRRLLQKPSQEP